MLAMMIYFATGHSKLSENEFERRYSLHYPFHTHNLKWDHWEVDLVTAGLEAWGLVTGLAYPLIPFGLLPLYLIFTRSCEFILLMDYEIRDFFSVIKLRVMVFSTLRCLQWIKLCTNKSILTGIELVSDFDFQNRGIQYSNAILNFHMQ